MGLWRMTAFVGTLLDNGDKQELIMGLNEQKISFL